MPAPDRRGVRVDPFELPEWLGTEPVTWTAQTGVRGAHWIAGCLGAGDGAAAVRPDGRRRRVPASRCWTTSGAGRPTRRGSTARCCWSQYDGRLTLAVPGTAYSADGALETLGRLAKAVGVPAGRFTRLPAALSEAQPGTGSPARSSRSSRIRGICARSEM